MRESCEQFYTVGISLMESNCQHMKQFKNCDECSYENEELQTAEQSYSKRTQSSENNQEERKKIKTDL